MSLWYRGYLCIKCAESFQEPAKILIMWSQINRQNLVIVMIVCWRSGYSRVLLITPQSGIHTEIWIEVLGYYGHACVRKKNMWGDYLKFVHSKSCGCL